MFFRAFTSVAAAGLLFLSAAQAGPLAPYTFESLMETIKIGSVRSVNELLPLLPESYRKNFVMMMRSGSLQTARPDAPRIIAFGGKGYDGEAYYEKNLDRLMIGIQSDDS